MSVLTFKESHSKKNCAEKEEKIVEIVIEIPDCEKKPADKKAKKAEAPVEAPKAEEPKEEAPAEEAKPEVKEAPKAKKSAKK